MVVGIGWEWSESQLGVGSIPGREPAVKGASDQQSTTHKVQNRLLYNIGNKSSSRIV